MAVQPIFGGGQMVANAVTTSTMARGLTDAAPVLVAQAVQFQTLRSELDRSAERAHVTLDDSGPARNYDIHARIEPTQPDGQERGRNFDQSA